MRVLLDTHAYTWTVLDSSRLTRRAREVILDPDTELIVSAVVPWELTTKWRLGKWPDAVQVLSDLEIALTEGSVTPLPINLHHARHAGLLRAAHRDPFDRLLVAQADLEKVPVVTADLAFRNFDIEVVW